MFIQALNGTVHTFSSDVTSCLFKH